MLMKHFGGQAKSTMVFLKVASWLPLLSRQGLICLPEQKTFEVKGLENLTIFSQLIFVSQYTVIDKVIDTDN